MEKSQELVTFLSDPATLVALGIVAAGAAYYMLWLRNAGLTTRVVDLTKQTYDLPNGIKTSNLVKDGEMVRFVFEDAKTLYEGFQRGKRVSNDGPCLGTRPSGDSPYQWMTYSQVEERFLTFGAGLCNLGVPLGQTSFIGLYGPNCVEWVVVEQSCSAYSRVVVPLYDTLGKEAVTHIINQAEIKCVVCDSKKVMNLVSVKDTCPQLNMIVVFGDTVSEEDRKCAEEADIKIFTMREVEEEGRNNPVEIQPAQPDDLSTICYTSGTTGLPKGVMLTNENIISNVSGIYLHNTLGGAEPISSKDSHISYMPLAHMMERACQAVMFMTGASVGFFRGDIKTLVNDIQELKPTIFLSVPRLLNKLYDKTMSAVSGSRIKKWLFETGFQSKLSEVRRGVVRRDSWWDLLVFRKVQMMLGGRIRLVISGSAPIGSSVMDFLRVAFGCQVCEGYGQTEATAGVTITNPKDTTTGHVGVVLACVRVKLRDVPDMKYFAANGEGEVCFKGPSVTQGYYKNPKKTAELFDEDGWVRSGDVGKWLPNGTLKIVDRVKHIFKLSQGEYIAPEKIEGVCTRSSFIAQMFLTGDSLKCCCVAIVVPDEEELMRWASSYGRKGTSFEDLCGDTTVHHVVLEDLKETARAGGLNSLEIPKAIKLCSAPFSVENDLLTPTFKLKRPQAKAHFMDDIEEMYSKLPA